jgi:class 3 adenylate cyclase/HAMP domain-containing protein
MSIRRRLTLAFLAIIALFALAQAFQIWSTRLRAASMTTLSHALKRQLVMSSFQHRVDNLQKQVSLLGDVASPGDVPEARASFELELQRAASDVAVLKGLSDGVSAPRVAELEATYLKLADAWRQFYSYLGSEPGWAVAFQVRAEPLGRRVLTELLPQLARQQNELTLAAEADFDATTRLTQRVSVAIFGLSMLVAVSIAYLMGRSLSTALDELRTGASMIGAMQLDHRIAVRSHDEIGMVAQTFNEMAIKLADARQLLTEANAELSTQNSEIERQRRVSQTLLENILPDEIATELAADGKVAPRFFEDVTIFFSDFVGFTGATERLAAEELVERLHGYFTAFDRIMTRYGLEKLKTIGDSYMCAGGLPVRTASHPVDAALAAFEMVEAVAEQGRLYPEAAWGVRIGLHTGPVVAGVVGIKKFAFDVWGETVNYASRMESSGVTNRINVSGAAHRRLKDFFVLEPRGLVTTKDKRQVEMYFVNGILPSLSRHDEDGVPVEFRRRYRTYFQKELESFPRSAFAVQPLRGSDEVMG